MTEKNVLFDGKKYVIFHKYSSGFCEIREEKNQFHIELVHISELLPIYTEAF